MQDNTPPSVDASTGKVTEIAPPEYNNIPQEIRDIPAWLNFTSTWDDKQNKWTKPPCDANGRLISGGFKNKVSYDTAAARQSARPDTVKGVGFSFDDKQHGIVGLDFDHVVVDGKILPEVEDILKELDSYTEYSISGDGLHVLVEAKDFELPGGKKKKCFPHHFGDNRGLEIFTGTGYLTISGKRIDRFGTTVKGKRKTVLNKIYKAAGKKADAAAEKAAKNPQGSSEFTDVGRFIDMFEKATGISVTRTEAKHDNENTTMLHLERCPWEQDSPEAKDRLIHPKELHPSGQEHPVIFFNKGKTPGYYCFHSHCEKRSWQDIVDLFPDLPAGDFIERFNRSFAIVSSGCEVRVINKTDPDKLLSTAKNKKAFFEEQAFETVNYTDSKGNLKEVFLAGEWFKSKRAERFMKGFGLFPVGKAPDGVYNLFNGFAFEPAEEGTWDMLRRHWHGTICKGDDDLFDWMFMWFADIIQNPVENVPGTAILLKGEQGTGKSILASIMRKMIGGRHVSSIAGSESLFRPWNLHQSTSVLIDAAEVTFHGDKARHNTLKGMITGETRKLEGKFRDIVEVTNICRYLFTTNAEQAIPAERTERRFLILEVPNDKEDGFFKKMLQELDEGGYARLMYDLMRVKVDRDKLRKAPVTDELLEEKQMAMNDVEMFLDYFIESKGAGMERMFDDEGREVSLSLEENTENPWCEFVHKDALYERYREFFEHNKFQSLKFKQKSTFFLYLGKLSSNGGLGIRSASKDNNDKRIWFPGHEWLSNKWREFWRG